MGANCSSSHSTSGTTVPKSAPDELEDLAKYIGVSISAIVHYERVSLGLQMDENQLPEAVLLSCGKTAAPQPSATAAAPEGPGGDNARHRHARKVRFRDEVPSLDELLPLTLTALDDAGVSGRTLTGEGVGVAPSPSRSPALSPEGSFVQDPSMTASAACLTFSSVTASAYTTQVPLLLQDIACAWTLSQRARGPRAAPTNTSLAMPPQPAEEARPARPSREQEQIWRNAAESTVSEFVTRRVYKKRLQHLRKRWSGLYGRMPSIEPGSILYVPTADRVCAPVLPGAVCEVTVAQDLSTVSASTAGSAAAGSDVRFCPSKALALIRTLLVGLPMPLMPFLCSRQLEALVTIRTQMAVAKAARQTEPSGSGATETESADNQSPPGSTTPAQHEHTGHHQHHSSNSHSHPSVATALALRNGDGTERATFTGPAALPSWSPEELHRRARRILLEEFARVDVVAFCTYQFLLQLLVMYQDDVSVAEINDVLTAIVRDQSDGLVMELLQLVVGPTAAAAVEAERIASSHKTRKRRTKAPRAATTDTGDSTGDDGAGAAAAADGTPIKKTSEPDKPGETSAAPAEATPLHAPHSVTHAPPQQDEELRTPPAVETTTTRASSEPPAAVPLEMPRVFLSHEEDEDEADMPIPIPVPASRRAVPLHDDASDDESESSGSEPSAQQQAPDTSAPVKAVEEEEEEEVMPAVEPGGTPTTTSSPRSSSPVEEEEEAVAEVGTSSSQDLAEPPEVAASAASAAASEDAEPGRAGVHAMHPPDSDSDSNNEDQEEDEEGPEVMHASPAEAHATDQLAAAASASAHMVPPSSSSSSSSLSSEAESSEPDSPAEAPLEALEAPEMPSVASATPASSVDSPHSPVALGTANAQPGAADVPPDAAPSRASATGSALPTSALPRAGSVHSTPFSHLLAEVSPVKARASQSEDDEDDAAWGERAAAALRPLDSSDHLEARDAQAAVVHTATPAIAAATTHGMQPPSDSDDEDRDSEEEGWDGDADDDDDVVDEDEFDVLPLAPAAAAEPEAFHETEAKAPDAPPLTAASPPPWSSSPQATRQSGEEVIVRKAMPEMLRAEEKRETAVASAATPSAMPSDAAVVVAVHKSRPGCRPATPPTTPLESSVSHDDNVTTEEQSQSLGMELPSQENSAVARSATKIIAAAVTAGSNSGQTHADPAAGVMPSHKADPSMAALLSAKQAFMTGYSPREDAIHKVAPLVAPRPLACNDKDIATDNHIAGDAPLQPPSAAGDNVAPGETASTRDAATAAASRRQRLLQEMMESQLQRGVPAHIAAGHVRDLATLYPSPRDKSARQSTPCTAAAAAAAAAAAEAPARNGVATDGATAQVDVEAVLEEMTALRRDMRALESLSVELAAERDAQREVHQSLEHNSTAAMDAMARRCAALERQQHETDMARRHAEARMRDLDSQLRASLDRQERLQAQLVAANDTSARLRAALSSNFT